MFNFLLIKECFLLRNCCIFYVAVALSIFMRFYSLFNCLDLVLFVFFLISLSHEIFLDCSGSVYYF